MSKIFRVIEPKSEQDALYEPYEYLIRWIGRNGADYEKMFYDAEVERRVNSDIINEDDAPEAIISSENKSVMLQLEDLSLSDLAVVLELFGNKSVSRLLKDGTTEIYGTDSNSYRYRLMDGRYQVTFKLIAKNLAVWN